MENWTFTEANADEDHSNGKFPVTKVLGHTIASKAGKEYSCQHGSGETDISFSPSPPNFSTT